MPAVLPSPHRTVPDLEAAIVATELWLSDRLAHLARCRTVGRDTTVAENLVLSAGFRLEPLWQERRRRLVDGQDNPA